MLMPVIMGTELGAVNAGSVFQAIGLAPDGVPLSFPTFHECLLRGTATIRLCDLFPPARLDVDLPLSRRLRFAPFRQVITGVVGDGHPGHPA